MNEIILDNQYFGCINYYLILFKNRYAKIEQYDRWQKASFRNRCAVATANGMLYLTVPVESGRNQKTVFKEVKIDYLHNWQQQHWRTLISAYNKSPFFEYYQSGLEKLLHKKHNFLFDLDVEILNWVIKTLKVEINISYTELYEKKYSNEIIDYRNEWLPKNFQQKNNIIQYTQVFEKQTGFIPNLSILDLLFNEGPNTINIFKKQVEYL
ncbi:MAG: WbqC family protein [Bacteroidetes bacterium]|nr:WbqC family protein [Bacteroidota bacterium]MBS1650081.1 WbqC family protein [Bacteroidota bacterium]